MTYNWSAGRIVVAMVLVRFAVPRKFMRLEELCGIRGLTMSWSASRGLVDRGRGIAVALAVVKVMRSIFNFRVEIEDKEKDSGYK